MFVRQIVQCVAYSSLLGVAMNAMNRAGAAEPAAVTPSTYEQDLKFLAAHTDVLELTNDFGGRVAICPLYQGRVMTSTAQGMSGRSFGWINRKFIASGEKDLVFNNYGGEDRFWLAPEAGQFALFFAPGAKQELANWRTLSGLNEGGFRLASGRPEPFYRLTARRQLLNASNTPFDIEINRVIRLVSPQQLGELLGKEAAALVGDPKSSRVKTIGFSTENTITNAGPPMTKEGGLVSIWTLGQFQPGLQTIILIPYKAGDDAALGPVVTSDYFGAVPPERLKVLPSGVAFRGDGNFRAKIGISPARAKPVGGSIDFANKILTIVHYTLPADAAQQLYINNAWDLPQTEPYKGDAFNSYNDGAAEPGAESLGGFYELETLSPARPLATGDSLSHTHSTFHFQGELEDLGALTKAILGIDLDDILAAFP